MMYIIILLLILCSIKPLNYAKYNWVNKQYLQSVGVVLIVAVAVGLPVYVMLSR